MRYLLVFLYRQRFRLSGFVVLVAALVFALTIHDFLAISRPVVGNILVVEGWIWNSSAIKEAADEFSRGHYELLVTVGGPIGEEGPPGEKNSAVLAAIKLQELGVNKSHIIVLPVPNLTFHRTYASALTLKHWLIGSKIKATGINVVTLGAHARKSLVLFERAFGPGTDVGVISGTDDEYDPHRWWMSATGIYLITRKTLGYLYAISWPLPESLPTSSASGHHQSCIHRNQPMPFHRQPSQSHQPLSRLSELQSICAA